MEISSLQHQAMATHLDEVVVLQQEQQQQEKKPRPHPAEQALKCPRCESTNTKFCYYNNYSLSQPRYFCKGCRRYWTKGGSLRNVPVGGGCRKNKRSSSSSNSSSKKSQDQDLTTCSNPLLPALPLPPLSFDPNDLTLTFANDNNFMLGNPNPNPNPAVGFLDILRTGLVDSSNNSNDPSGQFQGLYYGFGADQEEGECVSGDGLMMFPNLDGGPMMNSSTINTETANPPAGAAQGCCKGLMDHGGEKNKGVMGMGLHQWSVGGGDHGNLGLDWINGVGASSWHGLINSSLM